MSYDTLEAVVQVGEAETRYLRCGRGPVVLVVTEDDVERIRLLELLRLDYRVIAPFPPVLVPPRAGGLTAWLAGVIDGLGLDQPHILWAGSMAVRHTDGVPDPIL